MVALDGGELDGKVPVLEAHHGLDEPVIDGRPSLESTPCCVDVDRIIGVEVGQDAEGLLFVSRIDPLTQLDVPANCRLNLFTWMCHLRSPRTLSRPVASTCRRLPELSVDAVAQLVPTVAIPPSTGMIVPVR